MTEIADVFRGEAKRRERASRHGEFWLCLSRALTGVALSLTRGHVLATGERCPLTVVRCMPEATRGMADAAGLIDLRTSIVYLDGERLLGEPAAYEAARIDEEARRRLAALGGVLRHEIGHRRHTLERTQERIPPELRATWRQLEEPRLEAQLCRSDARSRALLRCSAEDVVLRELPASADGAPRATGAAALALVYGRSAAGVLTAEQARPAVSLAEQVLGPGDARELMELVDEVVAVADDDHERLGEIARRFREVVGEEPPEGGGGEGSADGRPGDAPQPGGRHPGSPAPDGAELEGELDRVREAVRQAAREATEGDGGEGEARVATEELERELRRALRGEGAQGGAGGLLAGLPRGSLPAAGERRAPLPAERNAATRLAAELRRIRARTSALEGRVVPPGRFCGRGAVRQASERARGAPLRGEAFRQRVSKPGELFAPHVAVAIDTSGSMSRSAPALCSVLYVLGSAIRAIGGRLAAAGFGDGFALIQGAGEPVRGVAMISCRGGTAFLTEALGLCEDELDLRSARRPRLAYVVSDGAWVDAPASTRRQRELRGRGVALVHVGIDACPQTHDSDAEVVTVTDARSLADVIAAGTRRAMERR